MIRVLFGTPGWPSGLLEVGSWASSQRLAQVVIRQIHPAKLLELSAAERKQLTAGPAPDWLGERLEEAEVSVPVQARLVPMPGGWTLQGPDQRVLFYILTQADQAALFDASRLAWPICRDAVREYEAETGQIGKFVYETAPPLTGQNIAPELWEALGAVGGGFLARLIRFRPHVIGFRLEGADEDQVAGFIRACRLFSKTEVVLGGPTATSHPTEVLQDLEADYVFAGEAEETFAQFLRLAQRPNSRDLVSEIPGLAYQYGGRVFHNTLPQDGYGRTAADSPTASGSEVASVQGTPKSQAILQNDHRQLDDSVLLGQPEHPGLQTLHAQVGSDRSISSNWSESWQRRHRVRPMASSGLLEANQLDWSLLEGFDRPMKSLFFIGSRGCPGACTFCAKLHGCLLRWKSADRLLEEIQRADECVQAGRLQVQRWPLFAYTNRPDLQRLPVAWAAVYDEDFFLLRDRAIRFFQLWEVSPLKYRYRLSFQTNPRTLLDTSGQVDQELLHWIDRLKPMIQLGGESFHPELLSRWRKRHTVAELERVTEALEGTGQDYTVFILLSDFQSTPEEVVDGVWLLVRAALRRPGMRIASSPFTIPLYDSQTRRDLEYQGLLPPGRVQSYRDYGRPQPGWMNPWAARLADLADAELHFALQPAYRDAALLRAVEVLVETIRPWAEGEQAVEPLLFGAGLTDHQEAFTAIPPVSPSGLPCLCRYNQPTAKRALHLTREQIVQQPPSPPNPPIPPMPKERCRLLLQQAQWALEQVRESLFQLPGRAGSPGNTPIPGSENRPGENRQE